MTEENKTRKPRKVRTRADRLEYAASLKRGKCLELLRPITQCTPAELGMADIDIPVGINELVDLTVAELCDKLDIQPSDLMFTLVRHTEGMRDISDVQNVMVEGDIINGVIPIRRDAMVERVITKTYGFHKVNENVDDGLTEK